MWLAALLAGLVSPAAEAVVVKTSGAELTCIVRSIHTDFDVLRLSVPRLQVRVAPASEQPALYPITWPSTYTCGLVWVGGSAIDTEAPDAFLLPTLATLNV